MVLTVDSKLSKMITIENDIYKAYNILDFKSFKKYLSDYHSHNGKGDNSLHEKNGNWFKLNEAFFIIKSC